MATERKGKYTWKSFKTQFSKLVNSKRQSKIPKPKYVYSISNNNSDTRPATPTASTTTLTPLTLRLALPSSMQSVSDHECDLLPVSPRAYKLASTTTMLNKSLPRYYFTRKEHFIMKQAWDIIANINQKELFEEYKALLFNDTELKSVLIDNGVDMQEQFDIIFGMFNKIITQTEYQTYESNSDSDDIITLTSMVLKTIGIRQANVNKIIPVDYTDFGSCFFILFEKYLQEYYRICPECRLLLDKCWKFIFESITVAFVFGD